MHKIITISLSVQDYAVLVRAAAAKGIAPEEWAADAVHLMLSPHTIDSKELADGYRSLGTEV